MLIYILISQSHYFALFSLLMFIIATFQSLHDIQPYERQRAITTYLSAIFFMIFAMYLKMADK